MADAGANTRGVKRKRNTQGRGDRRSATQPACIAWYGFLEQLSISSRCLSCCSHKSKIKCEGKPPSCQRCLRWKKNCHWPKTGDHEGQDEESKDSEKLEDLLDIDQRHALTKIFFETNDLDIMRQSIHRITLESLEINQETTLLWISIYCLSALYVSEATVRDTFNGESALSISQRLATVAQRYSRDTSDKPSGKI